MHYNLSLIAMFFDGSQYIFSAILFSMGSNFSRDTVRQHKKKSRVLYKEEKGRQNLDLTCFDKVFFSSFALIIASKYRKIKMLESVKIVSSKRKIQFHKLGKVFRLIKRSLGCVRE